MSSHARAESPWPDPGVVQSVLVVKFGLLGDMLLADAALAALRERYPLARLRLLADSVALVGWLSPGVADEILSLPLGVSHPTYRRLYDPRLWVKILRMRRRLRADVAVFLNDPASSYFRRIQTALAWACGAPARAGLRRDGHPAFTLGPTPEEVSGLHELDRGWRIAGGTGPAPLPRLPQGDGPHTAAIRRRKDGTGARLAVALQPLTTKTAKQWPLDRFVAVARTIVERWDGLVVLVGAAEEARAAESFRALGERCLATFGASFADFVGVLGTCAAFVGHDSAPFHVAVAAGRPAVVLAGPGDPRYYRYGRPQVRALRRCALAREEEECPRYLTCLDPRCLPSLPVEDVLDALAGLLEGRW